MRHVRKAYLSGISNETFDTIRLSRNEGGRIVSRKTVIYNLEASFSIVKTFSERDCSDYKVVAGRFEELLSRERRVQVESLVSAIKEKNGGSLPPYIRISDTGATDLTLLKLIAGDMSGNSVVSKKRIIVDLIDGAIVQALEDEVATTGADGIRRVRFKEWGD